jgi:hypothetical protein
MEDLFHEPRLFGLSRNDVVGTVVIAYFISQATGWKFTNSLLGTFVLGKAAHLYIGVDTALIAMIRKPSRSTNPPSKIDGPPRAAPHNNNYDDEEHNNDDEKDGDEATPYSLIKRH